MANYLLIATISLRYDLILLTTDKDFRGVPLLKQENWPNGTSRTPPSQSVFIMHHVPDHYKFKEEI